MGKITSIMNRLYLLQINYILKKFFFGYSLALCNFRMEITFLVLFHTTRYTFKIQQDILLKYACWFLILQLLYTTYNNFQVFIFKSTSLNLFYDIDAIPVWSKSYSLANYFKLTKFNNAQTFIYHKWVNKKLHKTFNFL